ncbi:type II toxin-antitoxin system RelE/ParE family toxin [Cocleimonas flava]|uniref:Toxin n=1 Tax=Cocleimonas flava TaxID=634765 RepID=A0A4V2P998_9GAMM|nr:type II toxin-antitoxin system RelE/ParE family toxin [Cocleimonas flava]TCJ88815.1 toxin ParE1/3/4 [Cocleimonas flava]
MANREILLRPLAEKDLEAIYDYSYQEFGEKRAVEYIHNLNKAFIKIADNPNLGSQCNYVKSGLLSFHVISHIVFFRATKTQISIIRVLHKSMDYPRHF